MYIGFLDYNEEIDLQIYKIRDNPFKLSYYATNKIADGSYLYGEQKIRRMYNFPLYKSISDLLLYLNSTEDVISQTTYKFIIENMKDRLYIIKLNDDLSFNVEITFTVEELEKYRIIL